MNILNNKKEYLIFITTRRDLGGIMLSEMHQTEKDTYYMILLYIKSTKTKQMIKQIKQK